MKWILIALFAAALVAGLVLVLLPSPEDQTDYPPDDVAEILVLDPDDRPVPGALVELLAEPAISSETESAPVATSGTTDENGRVRVPVIPFARYMLRVSCAPFATAGDIACFGGNVTTFRVAMPGVVRGVARAAETGLPIAGATVFATDYTNYGVVRSWRIQTDAGGQYAFEDAGPGFINIEAWAPGRMLAAGHPPPKAIAGDEVRCDVDLHPAHTIRVTAIDDETGEPIPEVSIESKQRTVTGPGAGLESPPVLLARVSEEWKSWKLTLRADGYIDQILPSIFTDSFIPPPGAATVRLSRAVPVTGRIRLADGAPAAGMQLHLAGENIAPPYERMPFMMHRLVTTDAAGSFSAPIGIPGGRVHCKMFIGGTWCGVEAVEIPVAAENFDAGVISLADGASVTGIVTAPHGAPLPHGSVFAWPEDLSAIAPLCAVAVDPRGRYHLPWVPKGSLRLDARGGGFEATYEEEVEEDGTIDIELTER